MNGAVLLSVFDTMYLSVAVYGVAISFALLSLIVPGPVTARRSIQSVSPLWLMVPAVVAAGLLAAGFAEFLAVTVGATTFPVLFLAQIVVSAWVLWHHQRFPWFVFPLAVVLGWIQWMFFLTAMVH